MRNNLTQNKKLIDCNSRLGTYLNIRARNVIIHLPSRIVVRSSHKLRSATC